MKIVLNYNPETNELTDNDNRHVAYYMGDLTKVDTLDNNIKLITSRFRLLKQLEFILILLFRAFHW